MSRCLLFLLLTTSAGCTYPSFTNPIVKPADAERFDELFGAYQTKHPDTGEISWLRIDWCADNLPKGFHKFVWEFPPATEEGEQGPRVGKYIGFVFKKEDSYVVQLPFTEDCRDNQAATISEIWGKSKIDGYTLIRLKHLGNQIRLDVIVEEKFEEIVAKKDLSGRIEQEVDNTTDPPKIGLKNILVTAKTDELGKFFTETDHDNLFKSSGFTFTRFIPR